jgi:cysteine synthase
MSMQLSREGIIAGPSSGEALHGLLNYLRKLKDAERLQELADLLTGEISCVVICCDLPYQYMDGYCQKLGENEFPPIRNQVRT